MLPGPTIAAVTLFGAMRTRVTPRAPAGPDLRSGERNAVRNDDRVVDTSGPPPNSVLGRAFTLLTAFRVGDAELTLAELCRRTGLPKATAHRLLAELADWDVVERTPTGLRLGMRLFELGQLAPHQRGLREAAAPFLADLFEATHETVHLAILDGGNPPEVVYLHKLDATSGPKVPSRIGGRMPAHCTGVGKAMLAFSPRPVLEQVLAAGLTRRTPRTVIAPGLLDRELAAIREHGVAEEHEESTVGIACVAAPVLDADGRALAAISITGWANRMDTRRFASAVRTAALGLSRTLRASR
jgi:DNA-binding IclR family transcriptional regulator